MKKLLHFLYPLLFLRLLPFPLLSSADTFINCGSADDVPLSGRTFLGDSKSYRSNFSPGKGSKRIKNNNPSSQNISELYQTARLFPAQSHYDFDITDNGTYLVRLHFFPFTSHGKNLSNPHFNVSTLNFTLLPNFTLQNSNSSNFPVIQEFYIYHGTNETKFSIYFVPLGKGSFAFVNAIEVLLLPTDFFKNETFAVPPVPNVNGYYAGFLSDVLRTVHRIGVGGTSSPDRYWRNWVPDEPYLLNSSASICPPYESNFVKRDPEVAPDSVYKTCRYVNNTNSTTRITWTFPVANHTRHLVRALFCDVVSKTMYFEDFFIYVDGHYNSSISPISRTSATSSPFWYDYVVDSDSSGYLNISIGPNKSTNDALAFLNGVEIMEFVTRGNLDLDLDSPNFRLVIVGSAVGSAVVVLVLLLVWRLGKSKDVKGAAMCMTELSDRRGRSQNWFPETIESVSPVPNLNLKLKMTFREILVATQNFDVKLLIGEGGFGKVYEGTLGDGTKVAVKRSDSSHGQGLSEFRTEVLVLSKIRHRHLVSLIGYCYEGSEMILVYEFMEKGTLREHLYNCQENSKGAEPKSELNWKQRLDICISSAKGLHYLHTGSDWEIIHRDVKSTNILLDEHLVAKVADFGLSQSGPSDPNHFSMGVKGSFGYLDPEYFKTFRLTHKSDVYSFGVVLLEVLCARPPIVLSAQGEAINLGEWGLHWIKKGELEKIIDPSLVGQINPNSLRKFGEITEKCLRQEGADRPSMLDVCWDLEYALQLQITASSREPHGDSTSDASSNLLWAATQGQGLSIVNINEDEDAPFIGGNDDSEMTASGVFSQLNVDGGGR